MEPAADAVIARAQSGDSGAFIELARHHEPGLRALAEARVGKPSIASDERDADSILLDALVEAFGAMASFAGGAEEFEARLARFVDRAAAKRGIGRATATGGVGRAGGSGIAGEVELWPQLATELAAMAPALAAPQIPDRRFPVVPKLPSTARSARRRRRAT